jgi:peptidoglycan-N-acetylglucosamine deacetylase
VLAAIGARTTFFPIAARAARQPGLIARMVAEGHRIGLRCDQHVRHRTRSVDWVRRDTARALERLARVGVRPRLWRTPYGDTAHWSKRVAEENQLRIVGWTVDTHDWRGASAEDMLLATGPDLTSGAIVLAHDGIGPGARRNDASETVRYTALVAEHALERGLDLRPTL